MTRSDLVERIAYSNRLERGRAEAAVDAVLEALTDCLAAGGSVELRGFGSFRTSQHRDHVGRNPHTGDEMLIPAHRRAYFRPGQRIRDALALPLDI